MGRVTLLKKFLVNPLPELPELEMKLIGKRYVSYGVDKNMFDGVPETIISAGTKKKFFPSQYLPQIEKLEVTILTSGLSVRGKQNKFYSQPDFFAILSLGPATRDIHIFEPEGKSQAQLLPGDLLLIGGFDFCIPEIVEEKKDAKILIYKGSLSKIE
jgi:hypothetical protein